nr:MAG TPA: restriction alleviation protein [Caudoviricetes sp.]
MSLTFSLRQGRELPLLPCPFFEFNIRGCNYVKR